LVARPPVVFVIDRMKVEDLDAVHDIERESFTTPWPSHAYRQELETNRLAHYVVARCGDRVVGYAGMWLLVDEAHVTTFATSSRWRRNGIGERLLLALLDLAKSRHATEATLEVRPSNIPARRLYQKYGFREVGVRPRYYTDDNEDALIMTTEPLASRAMVERLAALREAVAHRPDVELGTDGEPIGDASVEDTGRAGADSGASSNRLPPGGVTRETFR
jgi:[ribosomal protein S18]-alanine N-acetyltransferase